MGFPSDRLSRRRTNVTRPYLTVPVGFAEETELREGPAARPWLAALPVVLEELCGEWELAPQGPPWHGYVAVVVPVLDAMGTPAALKVSWPGPDQAPEAPTLRAWDGAGAVRLLRHDAARWALLLERLDGNRDLSAEPLDEAVGTIGSLLSRLHGATGADEIPHLRETAARWVDEIPAGWAAAHPPWPAALRDEVVDTCHALGRAAPDKLLHVDLHFDNVLAAEREPWLAIDPKGLVGDPAFESVAVLWNRVEEYGGDARAVRRRLDQWCETAGIDRAAARAWAIARIVEDALDRLLGAAGDEKDIRTHQLLVAALS